MKTFVVAKVLVVNDAGELLVLRRSQSDGRRPGQLDFPGGWAEDGEDILAAVKREAAEEAGLVVDGCKLVFAFSDTGEFGSGTWLTFIVRVQGRPAVTLSSEHDAFEWIPFAAAPARFEYERHLRMLAYVRDNNLLDS